MNLREAAQQALEALEVWRDSLFDENALPGWRFSVVGERAIADLRDALADTQDWDEIEALRESLREHMAEIKRLNECLTWEQHRAEHVSTHGPGCAMWGPKHYECLLKAYNAMKERTSQESRQVEPVAWITPGQDLHLVNYEGFQDWVPLYTAPPKREPLTKEQLLYVYNQLPNWGMDMDSISQDLVAFARAIERAHGIGGEE